MEQALKEKLASLSARCEALQRGGKHLECVDILEEVLSIKKQMFGLDHPEFTAASEKLCEELNLAAMVFLQKEKYEVSLDLLKKAELVAQNIQEYQATTYNNLACYYRRTGKHRTALAYLIQALDL
jgi:tetratricopeptide (TPR) repeat protein